MRPSWFLQRVCFFDEVAKHHVAHAETERREVGFAVAHEREQLVVAAAAGERAFVFAAVERFEYDPGVIREAAHNREVELDETLHAARPQVVLDLFELSRAG